MPREWVRKSHQIYYFRKYIADEFEFCGRDGNTVRKLHGKNMDNISHLMLSIRWRKRLKKQGKTTLMKALEENEDELLDKNDQEEPFSKKRKAATADDT